MFSIDNVRSLTQGVLRPFCHIISASLGVQQHLHFIGQRCWTCSLYTSCFFFACLAGRCSGYLRKWLKELKVCNDPSGRFGASLRCHVYTYTCSTYTWKWIGFSVVHTPISLPKQTMLWICAFTFGFLCSLSLLY